MEKLRIKTINKLLIGTLSINSMSCKFDQVKCLLQGKVNILVLTESRLDSSFPKNQFLIEGYSKTLDLIETAMEKILFFKSGKI